MHDHFETTIRESNSYPCRKLTYPHQPLEVWNNHHRLKRVPGCFFGGKGRGFQLENHWLGTEAWKAASFKGLESMEKSETRGDVDDGIGGGLGWVCR